MPFAAARKSSSLAPRRSATVSKSRFDALKERGKSAGKRLRAIAEEDSDVIASVAVAVGLGMMESKGKSLPTVGGYDPYLLYGAAGYALTRGKRGKGATMARQASIAMLTLGSNRAAVRGTVKVAGTEIAGDDDDDD